MLFDQSSSMANARQTIPYDNPLTDRLLQSLESAIIGQRLMLERLLVGLLANGHIIGRCARLSQNPRCDYLGANAARCLSTGSVYTWSTTRRLNWYINLPNRNRMSLLFIKDRFQKVYRWFSVRHPRLWHCWLSAQSLYWVTSHLV